MLAELLKNYQPHDETEAAIHRQLQNFLEESRNPYDRTNLTAHVVADAWILNPARTHVVLVYHPVNNSWMSPGGHCDGNPDVFSSAKREALEETGLANLKPLFGGNIFDLNSGPVPLKRKAWGLEPAHTHFDVCFAFETTENATLVISDESLDLKWMPLAEIEKINFWPEHMRRVFKTRNMLTAAA